MVADVGTVQIGVIYHHRQSYLPERKVWVRVCGWFRDGSPGLGKGCPHFKGSHARLWLAAGFSTSGQPSGSPFIPWRRSVTDTTLQMPNMCLVVSCLVQRRASGGRWNSSVGWLQSSTWAVSFAWNSFPPTSRVLCVFD